MASIRFSVKSNDVFWLLTKEMSRLEMLLIVKYAAIFAFVNKECI